MTAARGYVSVVRCRTAKLLLLATSCFSLTLLPTLGNELVPKRLPRPHQGRRAFSMNARTFSKSLCREFVPRRSRHRHPTAAPGGLRVRRCQDSPTARNDYAGWAGWQESCAPQASQRCVRCRRRWSCNARVYQHTGIRRAGGCKGGKLREHLPGGAAVRLDAPMQGVDDSDLRAEPELKRVGKFWVEAAAVQLHRVQVGCKGGRGNLIDASGREDADALKPRAAVERQCCGPEGDRRGARWGRRRNPRHQHQGGQRPGRPPRWCWRRF